jgi:signal peptidase I
MYLFLVDYTFISSEQLQKLIGQILPDADIVNCFSTDTLLKVTEKLKPDIIIIDYDLVGDSQADFIEDLRVKSEGAHILALIEPAQYDKLFSAIDSGVVDDYMVKPIRKEDLMARIYIATKRKGLAVKDLHDTLLFGESGEETSLSGYGYGDDQSQDTEEELFDRELFAKQVDSEMSTTTFSFSAPTPEDENIPEIEQPELVETEFSSLYEDEDEDDRMESPEPEAEPEIVESPEMFISGVSEAAPSADDDFTEDLFSEFDLEEPDLEEFTRPGENDITAQSDADDQDMFEETLPPEKEDDGFKALFEKPSTREMADTADESFILFEDVPSEEEAGKAEEADDSIPPDKPVSPLTEPGPSAVKPALEFLDGREEAKQDDSSKLASGLQEDNDNYFDSLFFEEPAVEKKQESKAGAADSDSSFPDEDDPFKPPISRRTVKPKSDLPGESADAFLYGESGQEDDFGEDLFDDFDGKGEEEKEAKSRLKKQKGSGSKLAKGASIIGNIVFVLLLLMMAVLSFFLIQSRISGGVPQVAGYQMYIVLSGSMSPEFDTGSLVFVREEEPQNIVVGDVITFRSQAGSDSLTTHRVVEVLRNNGLRFVTRGDANNVNDPNPVPSENVVGRVTASVPYIGYLMNFVQTRQGLILLIFVPGVLIILFELGKIMKYLTDDNQKKKKKQESKQAHLAEE